MLLMLKYKQLTSEQRYAIYLGIENGDNRKAIAGLIGVSPATVSREVRRNKNKHGGYSWRPAHELITKRLGVPVYFADPYSSWQKGAIENGNKLIRQYIPKGKGISFKNFSDMGIKKIRYKINRRSREKLDFNSPKNEFYKQLM